MLHAKYKGAGERPVEEVAGLVGFKLPKQYQDSPGDATKKWHQFFHARQANFYARFFCCYSTGAY